MMDALYDPYEENSPEEGDGCSVGTGGQGGSEPGCHDEYVYVEVSYDGGLTWVEMWEGWAEVCV
jgi:hypothetical protein